MCKSVGEGRSWARAARFGGTWAAILMLAALPAWGSPFSYNEGFDAVPAGAKPPGWFSGCTDGGTNGPGLPALEPAVMSADTPGWTGQMGALGTVNYAVPWSGGKRFNILHPGQGTSSRAGQAWYTGDGGPHTGSYPLDLKNSSLKAEFDLSLRSGASALRTHGFTFAVQPASNGQDFQHYGIAFGRLGWGMNGFSVEVDVYNNNAGVGTSNGYGDPDDRHIGINVFRMWDVNGYGVQSLKTNVQQGITIPFQWWNVGDNNQPLHITVYYNDSSRGGPGVVRVYLKVDPATKAAGDPAVPAGQAAFSFGMDPGDAPEGRLVIETCIGAWPGEGAVFGFAAGCSGSNAIYQVDNVSVQTSPADTAGACAVAYPPPDPGVAPASGRISHEFVPYLADYTGSPVDLAGLGVAPIAGATLGNLSRPGWDVNSYPLFADWVAPVIGLFEQSVAYCEANGIRGGKLTGEPDINYTDTGNGDGTLLVGTRTFPGMPAFENQWFGILAKGYIYFPPDTDGSNPYPRPYSLCADSDNGMRLRIGGQVVMETDDDGRFRGWNSYNNNVPPGTVSIGAGYFRDIVVSAPGVYTIQFTFNERWGGGYVELFRRTDNPMAPYVLLGSSKGGLADQPLIFGLLNGQENPIDVGGATPTAIPSVTLSPTERVGDVNDATGNQVFRFKTVVGPKRWEYQGWADYTAEQATASDIYWSIDEIGRTTALRWLDVLNNGSGQITTATLSFTTSDTWWDLLMWHPAWPAGTPHDQFGSRAEGYAVFPHAGSYWIGVTSDDESWIRFGNQTVFTTWCCNQPGRVFRLDVPEAGTYPIRVEQLQGGGWGSVNFYEVTPDHPWALVNSPESTIKVYESCASGPYKWKPHGKIIPGDRRVADVGAGNNLGWNGKLCKSMYDLYTPAIATASLENNMYVLDPGGGGGAVRGPEDTDTPLTLNYWEETDVIDFVCCENMVAGFLPRWHSAARFWQEFGPNGLVPHLNPPDPNNPGPGNDQFAASFTGYIEFPVAGDYALNLQLEDTGMMWIAGQVVSLRDWTSGWPFDSQPAIVHVDTPGLYDIRVDYFEQYWNAILAAFQVLPDGTAVPINDPAATVKVYRDLSVAPSHTTWQNPVRVAAGTKAAPLNRAGDPGFHVQIANTVYLDGNGETGVGHDNFITLRQADELIASVFDGVPSFNQAGAVAFDGVVNRLAMSPGAWDNWPGSTQDDFFAARVKGYLALKAGGHIFAFYNDDGVRFTLGDQAWETGSGKGGRWEDMCYFHIPEDGLYPFQIDYLELWGGNTLHLIELTDPSKYPWESNFNGWEFVNDGDTLTKAFVNVLPCYPRSDVDGDADVDQSDFGVFQECFTGTLDKPSSLALVCKCFDRNSDGDVDVEDLNVFVKCVSGPTVLWVSTPECGS